MSAQPTIDILGLRYARLSAPQALDEAERLYEAEDPAWIAVENVHGVNLATSDPVHIDRLNRADLLLNDGKGVLLGARLQGDRFIEDLNGNHFSPLLLRRAADRGWPVFFLGAAPGVAQRAADKVMADIPGLKVTGVRDGFFKDEDLPAIYESIRESGGGLLFVGMGNPIQEKWLDEHMNECGARLGVTVGAFFDFQAGEVERAPGWMNRIGLEWVHRLFKEPKRMWRRYLLGNPRFIFNVIRSRFARKGS
jgi:exopolysaccharide biosynthesis WecB/TagA/CpsF family protein